MYRVMRIVLLVISVVCALESLAEAGNWRCRPQPQPQMSCNYGCYFSCPSGWTPTGSCCRTWYYDECGNRVCTSYGTRCSPPIYGAPTGGCSTTAPARKKYCTPWFGVNNNNCFQYRDCRNCNFSGCGDSFRETRCVCSGTPGCP